MDKYGKTLRLIRTQKGLTLKELAEGVCSVSFLSKFERGDSDISFKLMFLLLQKLMVDFEEFLYIHHDYKVDSLDDFFDEVHNAYLNKDVSLLKELKTREKKKWNQFGIVTYHCNFLMIHVYECIVEEKSIDSMVTIEEIGILTDYLFRVEVWGYYELMIYNRTMLLLDFDTVILLSQTAYRKSARSQNFTKVRTAVTSVLLNTLIYILGPVDRFNENFKHKNEFEEFSSYFKNLATSNTNLMEQVQFNVLNGAYDIRIGKTFLGVKKIKNAIRLLQELGSHGPAAGIEHYLHQITQ